MKFFRVIAQILTLTFLITTISGMAVLADAQGVEVGDFAILPKDGISVLTEGTDYSFSGGELTINTATPVIIGMKAGVTTTDNVIKISTTNGAADVTLDNISIRTSGKFRAVQINQQNAVGDNPCVLRLVGTNNIENTYSFGYGISYYGENAHLTITSEDNGSLNVLNTGSNSAIVASDGADLTVSGSAEVTVTSEKNSGFDDCGEITVSDNAKVTITAKYYGIVSGNEVEDNVIIKDNAVVDIAVESSGIYTKNSVNVSGNAKLSIQGYGDGVAGIRAEKGIIISDYAELTTSDTGAYGVRSYDDFVTVSGNAKVSIKNVNGSGVYAETQLSIRDNAEVKVENAEDFGAAGTDGGFVICGNAKFTATNVGTGLYSSSNANATEISDNAEITVAGDCESGIKFNGEKGVEFNISGNPVINVVSSKYGSGISFGKAKATVTGNPVISITASGDSNKGIYASADGTAVIDGDAQITVNGTCREVINGDFTIKGNTVINSNAVAERGVYGDITLCENAKLFIAEATERGVYGNVNLADNSELNMESVGEEGIYGELTVADNAKITLFAVGADKVLSDDFRVIPATGKGYKVTVGEAKDVTEDMYYAVESLVPQKSKWRYFHAESTDEIPVTITVNEENTEFVFGEEIDLTTLFSVDPNAGAATYTVTNGSGEGTQNGNKLEVTKSGTFNVKVTTEANGIYIAGEKEALLTVNKATHLIEGENIPTAKRIRRGKKLGDSEITPAELTDEDGTVLGYFEWVNPDEEMSEKGDFVRQVKFVPNDSANYNEQFFDVNVTVFVSSGISGGVSAATPQYTITFDTNGGSKIQSVEANENAWLKKPENPTKEGYIFDGWFTDEELKNEYVFNSRVTTSFTLYAKWTEDEDYISDVPGTSGSVEDECDGTASDNCPSLGFDDLNVNEWYHLDTDFVIEKGLFNGTTTKTFTPNGNMTRAMLVTVLYRLEGEPATNRSIPFDDVDMGMYYANAVIWAHQNGIVKGISETEFAPDDNITREQIAAIMHRYAQYKEYDVSVGENTNILSYDDFDNVSEYAIPSMQYAVGSGLIKGRTLSTLNPKDFAARVELAAILHRFIEANK